MYPYKAPKETSLKNDILTNLIIVLIIFPFFHYLSLIYTEGEKMKLGILFYSFFELALFGLLAPLFIASIFRLKSFSLMQRVHRISSFLTRSLLILLGFGSIFGYLQS